MTDRGTDRFTDRQKGMEVTEKDIEGQRKTDKVIKKTDRDTKSHDGPRERQTGAQKDMMVTEKDTEGQGHKKLDRDTKRHDGHREGQTRSQKKIGTEYSDRQNCQNGTNDLHLKA